MRQKKFRISIITSQLFLTLISVAFVLIILMVAFEVRIEYRHKLDSLNERLANIQNSFLDIINYSLWTFDVKQLENSVKSIKEIDGVSYVSIKTAENDFISAGTIKDEYYENLNYTLYYSNSNNNIRLGVLNVYYHFPHVGEIIFSQLSKIFLRVAILVSIVFVVLFIVVNYFIADPISNLAWEIQVKSDYSKIIFSRKRLFKKNDEIDYLITAFNSIFDKIRQEIHEREEHEKKLTNSVNEKNVLISEVHHRVKNNLQIILSLLNLQKNESDSIEDALNSTINRIRAMSEVHEQLYNSNDFSYISMNDYINSLIGKLSELSVGINIALVPVINDFQVILDTAIPLGLIINELILNSIKYAFPERKGEIEIEILESNKKYSKIRVKDNGVGVKSVDDLRRSSSLGFHIVESLVEQIDGKIDIISDNGLSVTIFIPL